MFPAGRRLYSSEHKSDSITKLTSDRLDETAEEIIEEDVEEEDFEEELDATETESGTPWFLEEEAPRHAASQHAVSLPKPPEDSPALLEPMIKYVFEDMGLDDIALLDLRELDPPAALGPNLIMLVATARSERHLHVSAGRFVKWIRRNYKVTASAGGLIGPGELKTKLRRLRKKAKLLGTNTAVVPGGDNGISTGWVCVNFTAPGGQTGEATRHDEDGKFSGFGSSMAGTTVVVQCMTESRRQELDLESLWQTILKQSLRDAERVKGHARPDEDKIKSLVASRMQLPEITLKPSAVQWQALTQASQQQQQKRYFSTSLRRMNTAKSEQPQEAKTEAEKGMKSEADMAAETGSEEVAPTTDPAPLSLADLQQSIADLQVMAHPIPDETMLSRLISSVLIMPLVEENTATQRLAMLDQILLTAHERGMKIMSTRIMVILIDGLVRSPAWGEETQRAQQNIEMLLMQKKTTLDELESTMLMAAHAARSDWERFWNIFNWNTRFAVHRPFALYNVVFQSLAATENSKLCLDALRTIWPEYRKEKPTFGELKGSLEAARACIMVADPSALQLVEAPVQKMHTPQKHWNWARHHEGRRQLLELMELEQKVAEAERQGRLEERLT